MPNPKRRHSKARSRKRRTHYKATAPTLGSCSNCGAPVLLHRVCGECGYYRGKQAIEKSAEA
ncbi:MAG TPA: 50S ribosomal protein L32 [Bacteroidia bacterium]|jgi:large subunit ribosomal protein L32